MSVALPLEGNPVRTTASRAGGTAWVATVELQTELAAAEPTWRRLESEDALATPYQDYDFLATWQRHVGGPAGVTPLVVTAYDAAGRPILLWPMGYCDCGPFRTLGFLGGKHANVNFGWWDRDAAASMTPEDITTVLNGIAAGGHGIDLVALHRQPSRWNGFANPLLQLRHQASPADSCRRDLARAADGTIDLQVSRGMRKQLRNKDRKLTGLPGYRYFRPSTPHEVDRLLDWFLAVKPKHLAAQGLANAFAEPGVEAFVREICHHGLAEGAPLVELHATEVDGELLAMYAGTGDGRRFSSMFNTYTLGPLARYSPGLVLLLHMIGDLGERGFTSLDLGAGDATYKRGFCPEVEPLFDSFLPLTAKGQFAAFAARSTTGLKRRIKQTPRLFAAVQGLRRRIHSHAG